MDILVDLTLAVMTRCSNVVQLYEAGLSIRHIRAYEKRWDLQKLVKICHSHI